MYLTIRNDRKIRIIRFTLMSLILFGFSARVEAVLPTEKVKPIIQEKVKMCSITIHKVSVLQRKLNYQYWDSIEEPAPELFAKVMINHEQVLYRLLTTESYEYSDQITSKDFPCDWLAKRVHISIFDKDKSHSMEIIGEMTTRIRKFNGNLNRVLSGGAVRQLQLSIQILEDKSELSKITESKPTK